MSRFCPTIAERPHVPFLAADRFILIVLFSKKILAVLITPNIALHIGGKGGKDTIVRVSTTNQ
jgi:hypothetical protein